MFYGQYAIQLGNRKIISLPARFTDHLHSDLFITQGFDRNLIVMPENAFLALYQRVASMNMADPLARLLLRHVLANATFIHREETERIELSKPLYEYAELPQDTMAVLVGQGDHLEIWAQKHWDEQSLELQDAQKNAHRFATLDLSV